MTTKGRTPRERMRNYYWGTMLPTFARELFHDVKFRTVHLAVQEVHWRLKFELLPFGDSKDKRVEELVRSTSVDDMNDDDFRDYLNRLTIFAAENGIEFPPKPEEADGDQSRAG